MDWALDRVVVIALVGWVHVGAVQEVKQSRTTTAQFCNQGRHRVRHCRLKFSKRRSCTLRGADAIREAAQ